MAVKVKADVVGRNPDPTTSPKAKPTTSAAPTPSISPSPGASNFGTTIEQKLKAQGYGWVLNVNNGMGPHAITNAETYTKDQLAQLGKVLQKVYGITVKPNPDSVKKALLDPAVAGIVADPTSNSFQNLINNLMSNYLPGLDSKSGSSSGATNVPSRSVYQYQPQDIYDIVNNVYKTALGRDATDAEKQQQYALLKPSINAGTLTTSKVVKNAKTGKMEQVTTQTPGFSQKTAEANITAAAKKANPEEYQRQQALGFSNDLNKILGGGM